MDVGFIGLGRMGLNMVNRILDDGKIKVVAQNRSYDKVEQVVAKGAIGAKTIPELVSKLNGKKVVWIMLPSGEVTEVAFQEVLGLLDKGDIVIDGANSNFHDTLRRHKQAEEKGIEMLDVGVSGGILAADTGYPMMIGGKKETYQYCKPIFDSFGYPEGYDLVGKGGAGHYVKMIHNAIEYGMMQAIVEGFDLLENNQRFDLDTKQISHIWNNGTIVSSLLMQMTEKALENDKELQIKPFVADSGEGRWASIEALEQKVPFTVNSYALNARYISQQDNSLAFRLLAAIRQEFGGHAVKK